MMYICRYLCTLKIRVWESFEESGPDICMSFLQPVLSVLVCLQLYIMIVALTLTTNVSNRMRKVAQHSLSSHFTIRHCLQSVRQGV